MLTLYHYWSSVCSQKVRMCLAEKGLAEKGSGLMQKSAIRAAPPSKICDTRHTPFHPVVTTRVQQDLFPTRSFAVACRFQHSLIDVRLEAVGR